MDDGVDDHDEDDGYVGEDEHNADDDDGNHDGDVDDGDDGDDGDGDDDDDDDNDDRYAITAMHCVEGAVNLVVSLGEHSISSNR